MPHKRCSKCDTVKDSLLFPKDRSKRDGLDLWCKQCRATWRVANKTKEKARQRRHTVKWTELTEGQRAMAKKAARKYSSAWNIPMHFEDMCQEMLMEMAMRGANNMHSLAVDYLRKIWGVDANPNRIAIEQGGGENKLDKVVTPHGVPTPQTPSFLTHCLALIREHFWKKAHDCKRPMIFELIFIYGFEPIEVSRMLNVDNSRISQITTECITFLKKKLATEDGLV